MTTFEQELDLYEKSLIPDQWNGFLGAFIAGSFQTRVSTNPSLTYVRYDNGQYTTARYPGDLNLDTGNQRIAIELGQKKGTLWILDFDHDQAGALIEGDPTLAGGVKTVTGSAVDNTDPRNPVVNLPDGSLPVFGAGVIKTLSSDVAAAGSDRHLILAAESGTADNCIEITGLNVGDEVIVRADSGDTITIKNNDAGATDKIILYGGADLALTDDQTLKLVKIASGKVVQYVDEKAAGSSFAGKIVIQDRKTQNTAGGTFTSGADRTRDLNTIVSDPGSHASVSSNQITLDAGTYNATIYAPANQVDRHQAWWYNVSDSAIQQTTDGQDMLGTSEFSGHSSTGSQATTKSIIAGRFTIVSSKTFEVRHRCSATQSSNGYGVEANFHAEIYTSVELIRE